MIPVLVGLGLAMMGAGLVLPIKKKIENNLTTGKKEVQNIDIKKGEEKPNAEIPAPDTGGGNK